MSPVDRRSALRRTTTAFCVLSVLLATVSVAGWFIARRTHHDVTHRRVDERPAAAVPGACPAARLCEVDAPVRASVLDVIRATIGLQSVTEAHAVVDVVSKRPYLEHESLLTDAGATLDLTSRCVTGGSPLRPRPAPTAPGRGPIQRIVVVGGAPGCSVAMVVRANAGVVVPWPALGTLARSAVLQIQP